MCITPIKSLKTELFSILVINCIQTRGSLTPLMLLLVAEGFNSLMLNAANRNIFKCFEIKSGGTVILHFFKMEKQQLKFFGL